jgi:hypothetical protein
MSTAPSYHVHDTDPPTVHFKGQGCSGQNLRPVLVIDPEDDEQAAALVRAYGRPVTQHNVVNMQASLRSLLEPPRPEEPGTWGVVEASCVHALDPDQQRMDWVHHEDGNWYPVGYSRSTTAVKGSGDDWDSLVDPVVKHSP